MKSLTTLAIVVLEELGRLCAVSTSRDIKTVTSRVEHEGESFLTIVLPTFGKSFEQCLEAGRIDPTLFSPTWRFRKGAPIFLRDVLGLVFDEDGTVRDVPDPTAITGIRQVCLMFAKLEKECSDERITKAFDQYIETDLQVGHSDGSNGYYRRLELVSVARRIWGPLLSRLDYRVVRGEILPRHGSGAVAEQKSQNQKFCFTEWHDRLEPLFPWLENGAASYRQAGEDVLTWIPVDDEQPVRVVAVPKTQTTPRIIAIEPSVMQFAQQALAEAYYEELAKEPWLHQLCSKDSQTPNQRLAREGSIDGSLATIDLSEASDRVSVDLVKACIGNGYFSEAVFACRSLKADVLGKVITLNKFASMGSALTFPIETLVFTTVVLKVLWSVHPSLRVKDLLFLARGKVRVYGDDIICPVDIAPLVMEELEALGLKVNTSKSFLKGRFRESCGGDYYQGRSVRIARVRRPLPQSKRDVKELVALDALAPQLYELGYHDAAEWVYQVMEDFLGPLSAVKPATAGLGRRNREAVAQGTHKRYQTPTVKTWVLVSQSPPDPLEDYGALLKFFLRRGSTPYEEGHLLRAGRPKTARLKLRWVSL